MYLDEFFPKRLILIISVSIVIFSGSIIQAQDLVDQPIGKIQFDALLHSIAWSPDSDYLATASTQGLEIYDNALQLVAQIHKGEVVFSVDWHPTDSLLSITVSDTVEIWQWDNNSSEVIHLETIQLNHEAISTAWNVDGTRLAVMQLVWQPEFQTGMGVGEISIWDGANYEPLLTIPSKYLVHTSIPFSDIWDWSPNDPLLLAGIGAEVQVLPTDLIRAETDPILYILNTESGFRIQEIPIGGAGFAYSVGWQPDGKYIAGGGEVGTILYDISTEERVASLGGNHFDIYAVSWSPDGRYIASEQSIFDTHDFRRLGTFASGNVITVDWSPDGSKLAIANLDGLIQIWQIDQLTANSSKED